MEEEQLKHFLNLLTEQIISGANKEPLSSRESNTLELVKVYYDMYIT